MFKVPFKSALAATALAVCTLVADPSARAAEIECEFAFYGGANYGDEAARKRFGFVPVEGLCISGYLHGNIAKGDFDKVLAFFRQNYPMLAYVILWSPGGDVDEAIKIGRLLRKYLVSTRAPSSIGTMNSLLGHVRPPIAPSGPDPRAFDRTKPFRVEGEDKDRPPLILPELGSLCSGPDCVCASACALIWFGGVDRSGDVGVHRPRSTDPQFTALPATEAVIAYRRVLDGIETYLRDMEVPRPIIDTMVATGSAEIKWVDSIEDDLERPPSFAEWQDATCGAETKEESKAFAHLISREAKTLSQTESLLLKTLREKVDNRIHCQRHLRGQQILQLPRP